MIKRLALLLWIFVLLTACLANRQVTDGNLFQSSMPSMLIEVDQRIPYIGKDESTVLSYGTDPGRNVSTPQQHEFFYFADADEEKRIKRFVAIGISSMMESHWYYIDNFEKLWNKPLRLGKEVFGGHSYKTAYAFVGFKDGGLARYLETQGYSLEKCYALKVLHRLPNEQSRVNIWYGEDCEKFRTHFSKTETSEARRHDTVIKSLDDKFAQAIEALN